MSSKINYKRVWSPSDAGLTSRVSTLENNEYKITYFESVSAATGTITKPAQSTILLDQFFSGIDAYVSTIVNGQPTGILPQTSGGTPVDVSSFDALGNYTLTGTPSAFPVAIIYILKIKSVYYSNLNINNILDLEDFNAGGGGGISGLTTNELVYGNSATSIASLALATYPSLTELSYVKGVTSAIQTQINEKSPLGFTLQGSWASTSPADNTTYYASLAPGTIALTTARTALTPIVIPKNCTLKSVSVNLIQGVATSETVTYNIDVNSVSTLIGTTNSILTIITVSNYAMGVTCLQGELIYLQIVTPAWVTNPVNMRGIFTCYFE